MIYLDTSALAKVLVLEAETTALTAWLQDRSAVGWATSAVGEVELMRLAGRYDAAAEAQQLLNSVDTIPLTPQVSAIAATARPASLRTLDAIHLASALSVRDELTAFCCYDSRLADAARGAGLPVEAPA